MTNQAGQEQYIHGYNDDLVKFFAQRSAEREGAFLLPHLRPDMKLLDCGCGPGGIATSFASILNQGEVLGIDIEQSQVNAARSLAADKGIRNVSFQMGSIYQLPFPNDSFDAAFAHTVIQHLNDPVDALREVYRILKPGGVVGIREEDNGGTFWFPTNPVIDESMRLYFQAWEHNGGDPYIPRRHRATLREAGFVSTQATSSTMHFGTPESTKVFSSVNQWLLSDGSFTATVLNNGWASQESLNQYVDAWEEWGDHPDAFYNMTMCEIVGWKEISD